MTPIPQTPDTNFWSEQRGTLVFPLHQVAHSSTTPESISVHSPEAASASLTIPLGNIALLNSMASTSTSSSISPTAGLSSSTAVANEKPSNFTLFPEMARELRDMVWSQACKVERIVDLWFEPLGGRAGLPVCNAIWEPDRPALYKSHAKLPAILHTSREARATGLKYYTLEFGRKSTHYSGDNKMEFSSPARVYVNWEYDIICPMLNRAETHDPISDFGLAFEDDLQNPAVFPKLRRVAFAVDKGCVDRWPYIGDRENIRIILYPEFQALRNLTRDEFDASKEVHMELVDFSDEEIDEGLNVTACYPCTQDSLLSIQMEIEDEFDGCSWSLKECRKDIHSCDDPSHHFYGYPVIFKILKATITHH